MTEQPISSDVTTAIIDLNASLPGRIGVEPDGIGGAYVSVGAIDLGAHWTQPAADLEFHIPYNYPAAPIYPYYLPGTVAPTGAWPQALQRVEWRGTQRLQLSLRNTSWSPEHDTAVGCVLQVRCWLRRQ